MKPNARVDRIPFSTTLALDTRAKALAAEGVDVLNLTVGEPDFAAPAAALEAARRLLDTGMVKYTPVAGLPPLREAIAADLTARLGVDFSPQEVSVCHSAKHALSATLLTLVEEGDEVLLFEPVWSSYVEEVRFAGGRPVCIRPRADMSPDIEAIRAAITPRTRGCMLNSPSNPSGYVWSEEEVAALVELGEQHDLWILSDEIYSRLVYAEGEGQAPEPVASPARDPRGRRRSVIIDGASKTYAMTGFRIGYVAGPREIAEAVARQNSQVTGSPNAVSQVAYEAALREEPPELATMTAEFDRRRRVMHAGLLDMGLDPPLARGAFYSFPSVAEHLDERGSVGFCEDLLEAEALAIVPGAAFGLDEHVRLSYATSLENVRGALERLSRFLVTRGRGAT